MKITQDEVRYVAALANLNLTEEEIVRFQRDLDGILGHMDQLNAVDVEGVEPMAQVLFAGGDALREDETQPPLGNEAALANAPQSGAGYFKVPKVIER
ncbi:MAG TPA: Asp-tRNA(Asn)/Glu-tRNA(Gln) amidotransferase subunit GatC [Bryobacteraceae bacterium]|nr:Asp-tRNA(Asn)/Glu-tRNA(Gln) amidotransferase subunit GatC [Bryobacteraceae bacterium]